jgi:hypothetical protein
MKLQNLTNREILRVYEDCVMEGSSRAHSPEKV